MPIIRQGILCFIFVICTLTIYSFVSNVSAPLVKRSDDNKISSTTSQASVSFDGPAWITNRTVKRTVLADTPFARCEMHTVLSEDGSRILTDNWLWFDEKDAVNVAVMNTQGEFVFFRQGKYGLKDATLSPVGGMIEKGETAFQAAKREVFEELGMGSRYTLQERKNELTKVNQILRSKNNVIQKTEGQGEQDGSVPPEEVDWQYFGVYRTAANRGGGFSHLYLLRNAVVINPDFRGGGDDEEQQIITMDIEQTRDAVLNLGAFKEIKWAATLMYALLFIDQQKLAELNVDTTS